MTLSQLISASTAFIGELFDSLWGSCQQYLPAVLLLGFVLFSVFLVRVFKWVF